jgi:amidase
LSEEEIVYLSELIDENLPGYERIDAMWSDRERVKKDPRGPGYRPTESEDPYNAFVTKCEVAGECDGPLSGSTVGIKDSIAVRGIEMTWGTKVLEGYVPKRDATVVTRLLDAGASITGKTNLSACMFSGVTSELTATGPVANPRDPTRVAGGSSSGSAAAVVTGDVDMALGGDQGGSIRIPAAWSGCVGLKPTWGLVPYTGIVAADETLDHVGPMTRTVEDSAKMLDVLAGYDPEDPRQSKGSIPDVSYTEAIGEDVSGLTIGILNEGFGLKEADPRVDEATRAAIKRFEDLGVEVTTVSVPYHDDGMALWNAIAFEGLATKFRNNGVGYFQPERQDPRFSVAFGKGRAVRGGDLPPLLKLAIVLGEWTKQRYQGQYYARARNLARELTDAYDEALESVDALALPTVVTLPPEIDREQRKKDTVTRGVGSIPNNGQFNVTGHPALSIPCGTVEELPVGLQLVGRHFEDGTLLRLGDAFERAYEWNSS